MPSLSLTIIRAVVRGETGQGLVGLRGQVIREQCGVEADAEQIIEWNVGPQSTGVYLLKAQTARQSKKIKVINP